MNYNKVLTVPSLLVYCALSCVYLPPATIDNELRPQQRGMITYNGLRIYSTVRVTCVVRKRRKNIIWLYVEKVVSM